MRRLSLAILLARMTARLAVRRAAEAECFLQTVMRDDACARAVQSSPERAAALPLAALHDQPGPRTALAGQPPISRFAMNLLVMTASPPSDLAAGLDRGRGTEDRAASGSLARFGLGVDERVAGGDLVVRIELCQLTSQGRQVIGGGLRLRTQAFEQR
jgi:hypothetical protein